MLKAMASTSQCTTVSLYAMYELGWTAIGPYRKMRPGGGEVLANTPTATRLCYDALWCAWPGLLDAGCADRTVTALRLGRQRPTGRRMRFTPNHGLQALTTDSLLEDIEAEKP